MFSNETINCARIALVDVVRAIKEFDNSLSDDDLLYLLTRILRIKGAEKQVSYDPELYQKIRNPYHII